MSYTEAAKSLKNNIQVIESTFANNNLVVLNVGCKPYGDDDGDCMVYVELTSLGAATISGDLIVKINLYNDKGDLYANYTQWLEAEKFSGYDTIQINCYDDSHTLELAKSGKLFVTKA